MLRSLVGSEMCIRDRNQISRTGSKDNLWSQEDEVSEEMQPDWTTRELSNFHSTSVCIDSFSVTPLKILLSFNKKSFNNYTEQKGIAVIDTITKAIGIALMDIDEAPLEINTPILDNAFDTIKGLEDKLKKHYVNELKRQILPLIGSIGILGSPVQLFQRVSNGVADLWDKPSEGFLKSDIEGFQGIIEGAGSLIGNTVAGTFHSVNKITGSIANGISTLSLDDEYLKSRERAKTQKPKDVLDGLEQGMNSIVKGFSKGITGFFTKPFEGANQNGLEGFLKGSYQGISGLVIKPVTGVLDATSKAAEGIKNTASILDSNSNNLEGRIRDPRAFYGKYNLSLIHI
eukprot:TRINITY_DN9576_c0_g1_i1.p1 TRINITY_DN9576_c0_g1~~TRINITY_DN9576_c0_g1_i1.p1  ORF type:complete len:344 (+),score=63.34 TRINITY_DN9576_c0_g1_i1:68-1099(+)